jgi:undecaprenyl-diphosphatase
MNVIQAIILSIVEGFSEIPPHILNRHLILVSTLLHITQTEFVKSFEIFIQLGAILAVVVLYAKNVLANRKILTSVF